MDSIWGHIATIKNVDGSHSFELLSKVAKLVLVIPHSNAGEERVFNLIRHLHVHAWILMELWHLAS